MNQRTRDVSRSGGWLYTFFIVGIVTYLTGCQSAPDKFGELDVAKWRSDRNGCTGVRAGLLNQFKAEQQRIKGTHVNDIGTILGRPDVNQIADRNQKYYVYYLEKGPQCDAPGVKSTSRSVALRISAIGLVTEVTYQLGMP